MTRLLAQSGVQEGHKMQMALLQEGPPGYKQGSALTVRAGGQAET